MRPCKCCWGGHRRRTSAIGRLTAFLMFMAVIFWVVMLVLQTATIEDSQVSVHQYVDEAGYDYLYQTSKLNGGNGKNTPRELMNNNVNGRLPKEVFSLETKELTDSQVPEQHQQQLPAPVPENSELEPPQPHEEDPDTNRTSEKKTSSNTNITAMAPHQFEPQVHPTPSQKGPDSLELLRHLFLKLNQEQNVLNADRFPPLREDGLVLIVQVHQREGYLRQLLESLKRAKEIDSVLLIISHDYYYDEMNKLVQSIDFCRVVQIFYPYALQLFPDSFPGQSKDDCPRDSTKENAAKLNCTNAEHPDSYGHYREATVTAIKHHWWWKLNMVFDGVRATQNFSGYVLFLEEDHYVSPDFIVMAKSLIAMKEQQCEDCDFINTGMYTNVKNYAGMSHRVSKGVWNSGKNNMGFGMNRRTWNTIKPCSEYFCKYDDYNWDWSLNTLGSTCLQRQLMVLVIKAPRIFHIGTCGIHHNKQCNEAAEAKKVQAKLDAQMNHLFPQSLHLDPGLNPSPPRKKVKNYGGWGDTRDHELCLSFVFKEPS